jgi:hypothetical protein
MVQFQQFKVLSDGIIAGGSGSYTLDPVAGTLAYQAVLNVSLWIIKKSFPVQGTVTVDPTLTLSANMSVGQVMQLGPVTVTVTGVAADKSSARADIKIADSNAQESGQLEFDLTGTYIKLTGAQLTGKVLGHQLDLTLVPA